MNKPMMSFDQFAEMWLRVDTEMKKTQGHSFTGVPPRCQWCRRTPSSNHSPCPAWLNTFCAIFAYELTGEYAIPDFRPILMPVPGGTT